MSRPDPHELDEVAAWQQAHQRVCELVTGVDAAAMQRRVPACPDWTARDLLSHVVGLGADVLVGDEPDDHHEAWTEAQVDARRDRSVTDLVEEWQQLAPGLVDWMRSHGTRPLGDVVIHEQDLRGALEVPGARDTAAFAAVRERMAGRLASRLPDPSPVRLQGEAWSFGPAEAEVVVRAGDFDLGRTLMSRRTPEQLLAWTVQGDLRPHLRAFEVLGPLPGSPLPE